MARHLGSRHARRAERARSATVAALVVGVAAVGLVVGSTNSTATTCPGGLLQNWSFEQRGSGVLPDHWDAGVEEDVGGGATYATDGAWYTSIANGNTLRQRLGSVTPGATYELRLDAGTHDPGAGNEVLLRFLGLGGVVGEVSAAVTHDVGDDGALAPLLLTGIAPADATEVEVVVADYDTVAPYAWTKVDAACLTMTATTSYSLGNEVWIDADDDGRRDPGEISAPDGVVVRLLDAAGAPLPGKVTTTSGGLFLFSGLAAGDYRVELPPAEFAPGGRLAGHRSSAGQELTDTLDAAVGGPAGVADNGASAATAGGPAVRTGVITLGPGDVEPLGEVPANDTTTADARTNLTVDLGLVPRSDLTLDATVEGTATPGTSVSATFTVANEGTVAAAAGWNLTVRLPDDLAFDGAVATGAAVACAAPVDETVTCTGTGPLSAGSSTEVVVEAVVDPAAAGTPTALLGWVAPAPGDRDEANSLVVPGPSTDPATSPTNNDAAVTLPSTLRFALGNLVWLDGDGVAGDSVFFPGEVGLPGIDVGLRRGGAPVLDADGAPVADVRTDGAGRYLFTELSAGTYEVCLVSPGYRFTSGATCTGTVELDNLHPTARAVTPEDDAGSAQRIVDTLDLPVVAAPNLTATITAPGAPTYREHTATVDVVVANTGPATAPAGTAVHLRAGAALTPAGLTVDGSSCGSATTCMLPGSLAAGSSVTVRATLAVGPDAPIFAPTAAGLRIVAWVTPAGEAVEEVVPAAELAPDATTDTASTTSDNDASIGLSVAPRFAIGDRVWFDEDRDGRQDDEEADLDGALATLLTCDGGPATTIDGTPVAPRRVVDGRYVVDLLPAGCYRVRFTDLPAGFVPTALDTAGDGTGGGPGSSGGTDSAVEPSTGSTGDIVATLDGPTVRPIAEAAVTSAVFAGAAADLVHDAADLGLYPARADVSATVQVLEAGSSSGSSSGSSASLSWRVVVANAGPDPEPGPIEVRLPLPAGLSVERTDGTGWTCSVAPADPASANGAASVLRCSSTTALAVGASTVIDVAAVRSTSGPLLLAATVTGAATDPSTADNTAAVVVPTATSTATPTGTPRSGSTPNLDTFSGGAGTGAAASGGTAGIANRGPASLSQTGQDSGRLLLVAIAAMLTGLLLVVGPRLVVSRVGVPARRRRR